MSTNSIQIALKRESSLRDETLNNILNAYPDINPEWLLTGHGSMLRGKENQEKAIQNQKEFQVSSSEEKNRVFEERLAEKDKVIESKDKQIAFLQSNMEIIINAKDELLKAREEMIKQKEEALRNKDELIATQKQHIEELSRKNNLDDLPAAENITFEQQGEMTRVEHTKKRWDNTANPEMTRPPRSK